MPRSEHSCASRGKETTSLDARRTSSRSVKRKAWTSSGGAPATSEQPRRLTTPSTDSSASQHRAASAGVLSPPDMVWPANTLAQVECRPFLSLKLFICQGCFPNICSLGQPCIAKSGFKSLIISYPSRLPCYSAVTGILCRHRAMCWAVQ